MAQRLRRVLPLLVWLGVLWGPGVPTILARQAAAEAPIKSRLADSPKALVDEVWQTVGREFYDPAFNRIDWLQVRSELLGREYASKDDAYRAVRTALKKLGDPYTRFLTPREYQNLLEQTSGESIGVGMNLGTVEGSGVPVIVRIFPDGPAARAGLQVKDQIVAVDRQSVAGLSLDTVSRRVRGEKGAVLTLTLRRGSGKLLTVTLTRAAIELPAIKARLKQEGGFKLGYIQLQQFNAKAGREVRAALDVLGGEGARGWILDLRNNPGGRVDAATEVTSLLLAEGAIVSVVDRTGERETIRATGRARTDLPLVVMVDRGSASASEIVAGALQDHRRATLVGMPTFGKGVIQQINGLSDGSGLNVTIARYRTPSGREIHKKGISPDVLVSIPEGVRQKLTASGQWGSEADEQYRRAAAVLTEQLQKTIGLEVPDG
ncbi:S41 family peptidase [Gloeobacter violaceus]|uniref:Carboxyl-terminal protease n=1 Tax=Gloeobacter violaceus (strain ATCC 29082 / PCC 7421) TaxID=251221 RepID=Q7NL17_GLOVI|nr:S41 family peptidase [Gloeobacter violaceus]BAC89250.1 carboxyl-terminal protease [Gloeobacter violaceus PCC 7421]